MEPFIFPREEDITPEVVGSFINDHQTLLPRYQRLKRMYESKPPVLELEPKPEHKPDNRLVVNYARYITDTYNGYFIGIPVKVAHDEEAVNTAVEEFRRRNDMEDNEAELSKMCSIYGHAFEFLYQNEESETCCTYNSPLDMFIVYDDTIAQKPLFAVRYKKSDDGWEGHLFTAEKEIEFKENEDGLYFVGGEEEGSEPGEDRFFGDVPVIEYIENEERMSVYESVESLINAFDKAMSEKANDVDYFADAYLAILGAELDDEGIMRIRDNRIINLFGTDEANKIIVQFLDKPDGDQNQENLLDRLERLIYQMSMVANINDESFGNASGVSLEFKLQPMKNLAAMKERKFKSAMSRRYKMFFNVPTNVPAGKADEWFNLDYKFTRNIPRNIADEAEIAGALQGIVSKETQLSVLSILPNVKEEMERMEAEGLNSFGSDDDFSDIDIDLVVNRVLQRLREPVGAGEEE
jgi:SPP1 family phage portal protein